MKKSHVSPGQSQATLLLLDEMCDSSAIFDSNLFFQSKFEHAERLIFYHQNTACNDRKFVLMRNIIDTVPLIDDEYQRQAILKIITPILQADFAVHEQTILSWADPDGENYFEESEMTQFMSQMLKSLKLVFNKSLCWLSPVLFTDVFASLVN